jgi:translation elongation factor P/translation initiation factor 5A
MEKLTYMILSAVLALSLPAAAFAAGLEEETQKMPPATTHLYPTPEQIDTGMLIEATATVEAVDMANRLVTIKGPDGRQTTIRAGEEVKNLPQVKVGDKVNVKYYEGTALNIHKPGKEQPELGTTVSGGMKRTAPLGAKPAGEAEQVVTTTVEIAEVDPYKKTISFRSPEKGYRTVSVKDSHLEHYLKELKAGDVVEVVSTESVAIAVEPAK